MLTRQKTLSDLELCGLLLPVLDGLEAIHRAGMVHGDLKPSKIYIRTDGSPVLLDVGCARQAIGTQSKNVTLLASPGYAPIEQYTQGQPGPWTDLRARGDRLSGGRGLRSDRRSGQGRGYRSGGA